MGIVLHILKGDPASRDLEHVQVDSLGTAYLFFYDKQGYRGLKQDAAETLQTHVAEAFSEWISCFPHFAIILLPLAEGWQWAMATSDSCCQRSRASTPTAPCPTWFLVSQSPCHLWWGVPHLVPHRWGKSKKGVATLPGCPPHSSGGDPPKACPCCHPPQ